MIALHSGLTISVKIKPGHLNQLEQLLDSIYASRNQPDGKYFFPQVESLLFATWVIVPKEVNAYGRELPERLLLMTSHTETRKKHMQEMANAGCQTMHEVYSHCVTYPYSEMPEPSKINKYLRKHIVRNTFYTGGQYISVQAMKRENALRESIQEHLDGLWETGDIRNMSAAMVRKSLQDFVRGQPGFHWAVKPYRKSLREFLGLYGSLILFVLFLVTTLVLSVLHFIIGGTVTLIGLCLFLGFFAIIIIMLLILRVNENIPHVPPMPASDERIYQIASREFYPVNNEMSVVAPLKKGSIRRLFLAFTLWLVQRLRAFAYIPTVHTARWLQIDNGRRLVFIAYFDNTSEAYAHDFVDSTRRTRNLNLVFGHGYGFPPTRYAVIGGGTDRRGYMIGVRANQKITQVYYSAQQKMSILNINNNRAIRNGLFGKMDNKGIEEWLLRL